MATTIALVEDDDVIRENYAEQLEDYGYQVIQYSSRRDAESGFSQSLPDLALLDIGLNEEREGGFELCRNLRKLSETLPVIFLTAYNQDIDEISGLRVGADDYISKEESFEKILVRINSLLRRVTALSSAGQSSAEEQHLVKLNDLRVDMIKYEVHWNNQPLKLPLTQLWILYSLTRHPGQIKSKEALMEAANITHSGTSTIPVHINSIRKTFKTVDQSFDHIKNERGIGYRWKSTS